MPITLGQSITALKAQRELAKGTDQLSKTFERLSSGMRINRAGDDPASLAVALGLNTNARIFSQAIRNVNDGISVLSVAEGALDALTSIVARGQEIAEQAANGSYTDDQRAAMQTESDKLVEEFNRIVQSTTFNGNQLLASSSYGLSIQAGSGSGAAISMVLGEELARTVGTGGMSSSVDYSITNANNVFAADINGDGILDLLASGTAASATFMIGNGDGTFKAPQSLASVNTFTVLEAGDVNGDGIVDLIGGGSSGGGQLSIFLGTGGGGFAAELTFVGLNSPRDFVLRDINADGKVDLVSSSASPSLNVHLGNGNGTFNAAISLAAAASPSGLVVTDVNGDGKLDIIDTNAGASDTIGFYLGNGDGSFAARTAISVGDNPVRLEAGDFNRDGHLDLVFTENAGSSIGVLIANGDGTFRARVSYSVGAQPNGLALGDFNGDGYLDISVVEFGANDTLKVLIGNGDGTFGNAKTASIPASGIRVAVGDFNGDGVLDAAVNGAADSKVRVLIGATQQVTTMGYLSVDTEADARSTLETWRAALNRITLERGNIGAYQSRFEIASQNLQSMVLNFKAAESRIMDIDVATESANLARLKIVQQAATAVLAHSKMDASLVLKLLR